MPSCAAAVLGASVMAAAMASADTSFKGLSPMNLVIGAGWLGQAANSRCRGSVDALPHPNFALVKGSARKFAIMRIQRLFYQSTCVFVLDGEFGISGHDDWRLGGEDTGNFFVLFDTKRVAFQSVVEMVGVDKPGGQATVGEAVKRSGAVENPEAVFIIVDMRCNHTGKPVDRGVLLLRLRILTRQEQDGGHSNQDER